MDYKFKRHRTDKIDKVKVVAELNRVAKLYHYRQFTYHEFNKVAELCKGATVLRIFHSWAKALEAVDYPLKKRGTTRTQISKEKLLREMDRIWSKLGHRPSRSEWDASNPKYSYSGIYKRFSGWTNACLQFLEWKTGNTVLPDETHEQANTKQPPTHQKSRTKRDIPLKLRLKVLKRDNFCCVFCGKSPATHHGTVLNIDHIKPYSRGGETELNNLQTLCKECNWGKGGEN